MDRQQIVLLLIPFGFLALILLDDHEEACNPHCPDKLKEETEKEMKAHPWASKATATKIAKDHLGINNPRPHTGRTHNNQSNESYCLECVEGHTMKGLTEVSHAIDRYRTAKEMTPGVTEKVRVAIGQVQGIAEDVEDLEGASPEVERGLNEILNEARWIRKEYGLAGKGLTTGRGTEKDLMELKTRIKNIQDKAYDLVSECPTCRVAS